MRKAKTSYSSEVGEVILKTLADPEILKGYSDPQRTMYLFMQHLTAAGLNIVNNSGSLQTSFTALISAKEALYQAAREIKKNQEDFAVHPLQYRINNVIFEINSILGIKS